MQAPGPSSTLPPLTPQQRAAMNMRRQFAINYNFKEPENPSRYLRTFLAWINAMRDWKIEEAMSLCAESLVHRTLPESLQRTVVFKEGYRFYLESVKRWFPGKFEITIHEVIECGNRMAVHARSQGKIPSSDGGPPRTYENEYCFFIHFVRLSHKIDPYSDLGPGEELPKIELMKEFVDSTATRGLFAGAQPQT